MFENMTYENILNDMLNKVTSDVDKREGSIIYDALAPVAFQLAQNYFMLNNFIDLVFGDTAVGEYLDRVVADFGIKRKQSTKAIRKIITTGVVGIGTRWGIEDTTYTVTEKVSDTIYTAICNQLGTIGNQYSGTLENIDNVGGVTAELVDVVESGVDEETDDNLRNRFYTEIQRPSTSGNADDYIKWALEVPGVGNVRVFPLWNGNGTVKVLIVDSNMAIDETLEPIVYEYIETVRPIGASVTVDSPTGIEISVSANVVLDGSMLIADVQSEFTTELTKYLRSTVFDNYSISYARIGSILLSISGLEDYTDLTINGDTVNITINEDEIPIVGLVSLDEVV